MNDQSAELIKLQKLKDAIRYEVRSAWDPLPEEHKRTIKESISKKYGLDYKKVYATEDVKDFILQEIERLT